MASDPKDNNFHVFGELNTLQAWNNNTDIQPKISVDEISLLWLFCGC